MNKVMKQQLKKYIVGFVICLILTISAYVVVMSDTVLSSGDFVVIASLSGLALAQFIVQSIYFLHLTDEKGEKWKLSAFVSMLSVVLIVVIGSIWIMWNLNYNMMSSKQGTEAEEYILEDEGIPQHEKNDEHNEIIH